MIEELGLRSPSLEGAVLIRGIGLSSNVYVLGKRELTLVDTGNGGEPNRIPPKLKLLGLGVEQVGQVVITHFHFDHVSGLVDLLKARPRVLAHPEGAGRIEAELGIPAVPLGDGSTVSSELGPLRVIHTPGHTSDSICLYDEEHKVLLSGDTVFAGGSFGRTDLSTGDDRALISSLEFLNALDVDVLLPGHGDPVLKGAKSHLERSYRNALRFLSLEK